MIAEPFGEEGENETVNDWLEACTETIAGVEGMSAALAVTPSEAGP